MNQLEKLRQEIDSCDQIIVRALEERMKAAMKVLDYKRSKGIPIFQPEREQLVLEKALAQLTHKDFSREIEKIYLEIMRNSRKLQSKQLFPYNIVLIGFMGAGKSTVGAHLSKLLEMEWIDVDQKIEVHQGMKIHEMFDVYGEAYFRDIETQVVHEIQDRENTILSCGGGVVLRAENIEVLKKNGRVVLLQAEAETIYGRIKDDCSRPLLRNQMTVSAIAHRLEERKQRYYEAADYIIDTDDKDIPAVCQEIISELLKTEK
ncbi:shikimate kinase [Anaerosolibacter carboniphilus]|uniref:Shikimate kinase n=1 Tax=Anaerosolibacter carboniphilus TaxID=1417629 RepID=A0A841L1N1_9FIRM|nr:chorismate mutase [Anaerosolibacter carboniphilus]MBB6218080.1 shikimate kinase [Anaerosolibacter carboniphilus]